MEKKRRLSNTVLMKKCLAGAPSAQREQIQTMVEINEKLEAERRSSDELYDLLSNRDATKLTAFLLGIRKSLRWEFYPLLGPLECSRPHPHDQDEQCNPSHRRPDAGRWDEFRLVFNHAFNLVLSPPKEQLETTRRRVMHFLLLASIVELPSLRQYFYPQDLVDRLNAAEDEAERQRITATCRVDPERFQIFYNNYLVPSHARLLKGLETVSEYVTKGRTNYTICGTSTSRKKE